MAIAIERGCVAVSDVTDGPCAFRDPDDVDDFRTGGIVGEVEYDDAVHAAGDERVAMVNAVSAIHVITGDGVETPSQE